MALKSSRSRPWLSRLHLVIRLLGLTALLAAVVGVAMAGIEGFPATWQDAWQQVVDAVNMKPSGEGMLVYAVYLIVAGAAVVVLVLLLEAGLASRKAALRRGLWQFNSLVQIVLAVGLVLGLNVYSFLNHERIDCTKDQRFTLRPEQRDELRKIRGDTTIVVLFQGQRNELAGDSDTVKNSAAYESAAETILIEKVRDLSDQLRQLSAQQLRVVILDTRKKDYNTQFREVTKNRAALATAIGAAPENSLLFHTRDDQGAEHVQRLSFDGFLQLDRTTSVNAENLVLLRKGVEPVIRRIINLEQRKPRIGVLVPHPALSSRGTVEEYSLEKMRKGLEKYGFEVRDIVLRDPQNGEPAASTFDELRVPQLRNSLEALKEDLPRIEDTLRLLREINDELQKKKVDMAAFRRKYGDQLRLPPTLPDAQLRQRLEKLLPDDIDSVRITLESERKRQQKEMEELAGYNEKQARVLGRMKDLPGKLDRLLPDCDLLLIPRMTRMKQGFVLVEGAAEFYRLDETQLAAVRNFLKAGKPVLACLGPFNEESDPQTGQAPDRKDGLEQLLAQLGIVCSQQTILYDVQRSDFLQRSRNPFTRMKLTPVPAAQFEAATGKPNPLAESLRLTTSLTGADLDLSLAYPRQVTYNPMVACQTQLGAFLGLGTNGALPAVTALPLSAADLAPPRTRAEFVFSPKADNWNEDYPFPRERGLRSVEFPRYQPSDVDDKTRGTPDERRRGPFSLGVAVDTTIPWEWYDYKSKPNPVRVVVIGHGGLFVDPVQSPAREKFLLDTCNWLLGRDDLLNHDERATNHDAEWRYPRLEITERDRSLWQWGARLGLPVLCAYAGIIVLLLRRMS